MAMVAFKLSTTWYIHMAVGTQNGVNSGITMFSATINSSNVYANKNTLIDGYRSWLNGPVGRVTPALDFKHTGDGKGGGSGPALWVAWGRATLYCVKMSWTSGPNWYGPWTPTIVALGLTNQDSNTARYDGLLDNFNIVIPNGSIVTVIERNVSDTGGSARNSPTHPQGVVKHCAISNNATNSNYRIFAMGTTVNDLYYIDYTRATGLWGTWTLVTSTDILGVNNYGARRNTYGNGQYDLVVAHSGSPNPIVHSSGTSASAPRVPTILTPQTGVAADVAATLPLTWTFQDDDPLDSQLSYALRRQIGAGAFSYWNAGTTTWGASEVFNTSGTNGVTLATAWGADGDATHSYSVNVKDQAGLASGYSTAVAVIPSGKDNPTITSPADASTVTTGVVEVAWTVATQTARRVELLSGVVTLHDSGWGTTAVLSYTVPTALTDGVAYSVRVTTRNDEGLTSTSDTNTFTADFVEPATPTFIVTPNSNDGIIEVSVTNPVETGLQPIVTNNELYRRVVGTTDNGIRVARLSSSTARVNLLTANQASSEGALEWINSTNATVARTTAQALDGLYSVSMTAIAAATMAVTQSPLYGTAVVAERMYSLTAWLKAATTGRQVYAQVFFRNASDVFIGQTSILGQILNTTSGWVQTGGSFTTPINAAKAAIVINVLAPSVGEVHYLDRVVFVDSADVGSPAIYDDFTVASGVAYEYRALALGANGTSKYSAWQS
jgi:hypothetical protein